MGRKGKWWLPALSLFPQYFHFLVKTLDNWEKLILFASQNSLDILIIVYKFISILCHFIIRIINAENTMKTDNDLSV